MNRKAFQVVMRRTETRISEQTVTVHAETEADARVLAKYEETPFYSWKAAGAAVERVDIAAVKVADDPLTHYQNLAQKAAHQAAACEARN
ncbi:hypothetical protein [Achromobacter insolitus]|uniref:Uncharacterized protein n=1 Tax=Achromobacter insolitus TaxID=217204 RepID=A0A6S7F987_9BURK|nr:hypothetical protein [Achromobacter insolitus]CAB3931582.1 hypothetical protein LMG6000_02226 [Achromobacter insolitus]CAB3939453.1 hypothetical protein LMG5997_04043 [Achromobacter insolitus]